MANSLVNFNFEALSKALRRHVREKARQAGTTIVYKKNGQLIEENPRTTETKILREYHHSAG